MGKRLARTEEAIYVRFAFRVLCNTGTKTRTVFSDCPKYLAVFARSIANRPPHYGRRKLFSTSTRKFGAYVHLIRRDRVHLSHKLVLLSWEVICRICVTEDRLLTQFNSLQGPAYLGEIPVSTGAEQWKTCSRASLPALQPLFIPGRLRLTC